MGWLFMTLAGMGKHPTPKAYLDNQLNYEATDARSGLILRDSAVVERVYYAAISSTAAPDTISAVICLTKWNPRAADNMIFGYKDMDENSGPYNYGCPARILDLLTPTNYPHAIEWRAKCREQIALTSRPKPTPGDRIRLAQPVKFSDGVTEQLFHISTQSGKQIIRRSSDNIRVTLPRLMKTSWQLIKPALAT